MLGEPPAILWSVMDRYVRGGGSWYLRGSDGAHAAVARAQPGRWEPCKTSHRWTGRSGATRVGDQGGSTTLPVAGAFGPPGQAHHRCGRC